jgi:hypothetical protein
LKQRILSGVTSPGVYILSQGNPCNSPRCAYPCPALFCPAAITHHFGHSCAFLFLEHLSPPTICRRNHMDYRDRRLQRDIHRRFTAIRLRLTQIYLLQTEHLVERRPHPDDRNRIMSLHGMASHGPYICMYYRRYQSNTASQIRICRLNLVNATTQPTEQNERFRQSVLVPNVVEVEVEARIWSMLGTG